MFYVKPLVVTRSMIGAACNVTEDLVATAWVSGTTYAVGDLVYIYSLGKVYKDAAGGVSTVSPDLQPARWSYQRPTNRMAPFDSYSNTQAQMTVDIVYPITARFSPDLIMYGLVGTGYTVQVYDSLGGTLLATYTGTLVQPSGTLYTLLYGDKIQQSSLVISGMPMRPAAYIVITIHGVSSETRKLGMIVLGRRTELVGGGAEFGGTDWGAEAEPVTFSYIDTKEDGTVTIVPRYFATNLKLRVGLPTSYADQALYQLQQLLDVPVAVFASDVSFVQGLTTFGLIESAPVRYDSYGISTIEVTMKGIV